MGENKFLFIIKEKPLLFNIFLNITKNEVLGLKYNILKYHILKYNKIYIKFILSASK